jgi:iron(III) transport system substrate-binding protein
MQSVRILLTSLCIALCMALPTAAQDNAQTLVVYSGRTEGLIGPILEQFTQDTGIPVEVRYGGTAEMAATILEEGDNSPADVFIAQDASALGALAAEGRLIALPADILEQVQPQYESAAGEWVGISGRARALVYNTELVQAEALPASLLGLTQPEWQGKVGWAPPNGSFQSNITAMRLLLGEDATAQWLTDMVNNGAVSYENNDAITQAVIDGEISVGLVNHYYVFEFKEQFPDAPIDIHYFEDGDLGNLINVAGAGIINTSKQPDLAQSLIRYLLGETAQNYFAETTAEYPLVAGVPENPQVRPLAEIKGPEIDLSSLSDLQTTLDMLRDTGVTP